MPSFVITKRPIYRTFTVDESSAIYNIKIDGNSVEIIFQSNTEKAYRFEASARLTPHLCSIIESHDLLGMSIGSTIAKARKSGDLQIIEFPED